MSRKNKSTQPQPQFKHLRFADVAAIEAAAELDDNDRRRANVLLNLGGYTLAFRILDLSKQAPEVQAEWEDEGTSKFLLVYSWSECYFNDNFNRSRGRQVAAARLENMASDWTHTTLLELETGIMPDQVIQRNIETGEVDIKDHEKEIAKALVTNFIQEQQQFLFNGSDLDSYLDYLIEYNGQYVIDSSVLLSNMDNSEEEDYRELQSETVTLADDGKTALHKLAALLAPEVRANYNIPESIMDQLMCHLADTNAAFDQIVTLNTPVIDDEDEDDYDGDEGDDSDNDEDEDDLTDGDEDDDESDEDDEDGDEDDAEEDGQEDDNTPAHADKLTEDRTDNDPK